MSVIAPSPGRILWYYAPAGDSLGCPDEPLPAIVTKVHNERLVNVSVFSPDGAGVFGRSEVALVQDGDAKPEGRYVAWMPYQQGQAAKTQAVEGSALKPIHDRLDKIVQDIESCSNRVDGTNDDLRAFAQDLLGVKDQVAVLSRPTEDVRLAPEQPTTANGEKPVEAAAS